jgi:micrococcal nuclease
MFAETEPAGESRARLGPGRVRVVVVVALIAVVALAGCLSSVGGPGGGTDLDTGTATADESGTPAGASATPLPPDTGQNATVTRVVDGDTVEVELADGTTETLRLIGVDTPEVYSENEPGEYGVPDTDAGRACLDRYGERASAFATARLAGEQVRIVPDPTLDERGYYGRLLAYVYVDGVSFNYRLIEEGHARVFESDFTGREEYETAQRAAREADRGLWECATDGDTDAATARAASERGLALVEVHENAVGDDRENPNDEYVTFENGGTETIALAGWTVTDEADHTYTFPDVVLEPGERITLHTGPGTDTETDLYWGASAPVWNNGGDTVTVRDDTGTVVLVASY